MRLLEIEYLIELKDPAGKIKHKGRFYRNEIPSMHLPDAKHIIKHHTKKEKEYTLKNYFDSNLKEKLGEDFSYEMADILLDHKIILSMIIYNGDTIMEGMYRIEHLHRLEEKYPELFL